MEGNQIRGLMEAYSEVYQPSLITEEVVQEAADMWIEACIEHGIDFSEYTLDELTEAFIVDMSSDELSESVLNEILGMPSAQNLGASLRQGFGRARRAVGRGLQKVGGAVKDVAGAGLQGYTGQKTTSKNPLARLANAATRQATKVPRAAASFATGVLTGKGASSSKTAPTKTAPTKTAPTPPKTAPTPPKTAPTPTKTAPAPRPSAAPASKPAPAAPAKPVVKQTGDKKADMAAWAKANPKLAAAKAERDRTRGTSASSNPMMKDMPGKRLDPKPAPKAPETKAAPAVKKENFDLFDVIKGHLLDEGYAETEQAAMAIMANMSEEWRESIVEGLLGSGSGFLGSNAAELGAKGGHDALPWNRNTRYTTQGKPRKPGENIRGERIVNPPDKNKSTSAVTSDGKPR